MTDPEQAILIRICSLLENALLRLPKSYSEDDSMVEGDFLANERIPFDPDPDDPAWHARFSAISSRINRANKSITSGECVSAMLREKTLLIERERQSGRPDAASAVEITLEDVKTAAKKTMEWISDHADMKKGSLRLGTYENQGTKCDVSAKVSAGPPSIEFRLDCEF